MGKCSICNGEMTEVASCVKMQVKHDGVWRDTIKWGDEKGVHAGWVDDFKNQHKFNGRCPDCAVLPGGYHHGGCDIEECPKCGFQMIGCECELEDERIAKGVKK